MYGRAGNNARRGAEHSEDVIAEEENGSGDYMHSYDDMDEEDYYDEDETDMAGEYEDEDGGPGGEDAGYYNPRQQQPHTTHYGGRNYYNNYNNSNNNYYSNKISSSEKLNGELDPSMVNANGQQLTPQGYVAVRTKLYITNFPEEMDQEEMKQLFNQYGHVLECTIMWNQYAFVHFGSYEEAEKAIIATKGN